MDAAANGTSASVKLSEKLRGAQEKWKANTNGKKQNMLRYAAYGAVAAVLLIAIVVGAVVGTRGDRNRGDGSDAGNGDGQPSFPLDPKLHNSFWGLAYTPYGAIDCSASQANVTKDIRQLSQLTTRLRLYAADCNVTSLVVQAIQDLKVNMSVYAGIYVHPDVESYNRQVALLDDTLKAYGTSHILGVTVGNEYVLNAPSRGDTIVNATTWVNSRIVDYKIHLRQLSTSSTNFSSIPVGTSDAAGTYLGDLTTVADYLLANIHPWFSQNTYEQAAWFSWSYINNIVVPMVNATWPSPVNSTTLPPQLLQGEFGWPTGTDDPPLGINPAGSPAGIQGMQRVLDDWICPSNRNGTKYFWFEAYDEPWKSMYGGVEQHWGLFHTNGTLKDITIPDCPHD
ncbi:hypothetical protein FRC14_007437 [Serendipita sp. 396]|nr:hypothetical protein FRC14_007437 [Serendipita sp. 396]KAG8777578.1 hypothetical protein FRC15_011263 [Serendipita sp. 397]KAG8794591.1 hypothetical protein FRC16_010436 [Serendipita sp. 398]